MSRYAKAWLALAGGLAVLAFAAVFYPHSDVLVTAAAGTVVSSLAVIAGPKNKA